MFFGSCASASHDARLSGNVSGVLFVVVTLNPTCAMTVTEIQNKDAEVVVRVRIVESTNDPDIRLVQVVRVLDDGTPEGLESLKYSEAFKRL